MRNRGTVTTARTLCGVLTVGVAMATGCSAGSTGGDSVGAAANAETVSGRVWVDFGSDVRALRAAQGTCLGFDVTYRSAQVCSPVPSGYTLGLSFSEYGGYAQTVYSDAQCSVAVPSGSAVIAAGACRSQRMYVKAATGTTSVLLATGDLRNRFGSSVTQPPASETHVVTTPTSFITVVPLGNPSLTSGVALPPGSTLPPIRFALSNDAYGDDLASPVASSVPVTISGTGLQGTTTKTPDALGVVTFDDLVLPSTGTVGLTVSAPGTFTNYSFSVSVGPKWVRTTCSDTPCKASSSLTVAYGGLAATDSIQLLKNGAPTALSTGGQASGSITVPSLDAYATYTSRVVNATSVVLATEPGTVRVHAATPASVLQKLAAPTPALADGFGRAVAGDTTRVAIASGSGVNAPGAVHTYVPGANGWSYESTLTPAAPQAGENFGAAVAVSGSTVVVGAPEADGKGAAYVFVRSGSTWTQEAKLVAADGIARGDFGRAVAIAGDTALVGSPGANAAYVYVRAGGVWTAQAKLTPSNGALNFGTSVSLAQDIAAVGAPMGSDDGGSAWVLAYARSGQTWTQDLLTTAFAAPVRLSGTTLSAGSLVFEKINGAWNGGTNLTAGGSVGGHALTSSLLAFAENGVLSFYSRTNGNWALGDKVSDFAPTSAGNRAVTLFGALAESMTAVGGSVFVGAPGDNSHSGAVYVYDSGTVTTPTNVVSATCSRTPCVYGSTVTVSYQGLPAGQTATIALAKSGVSVPLSTQTTTTTSGSALFPVDTSAIGSSVVGRAVNQSSALLGESSSIAVPSSSLVAGCGPHCAADDNVVAYVAGLPGNALDWVGVYRLGAADTSPLAFRYTNGQTIAQVGFGPLPGGTYVLKAFANNGYTVLLTSPQFDVASSTATATIAGTSNAPASATITYAGLPGNPHDWISLAVPGSAATSYVRWAYTGGARSGTVTFTSVGSGTFVARSFVDDGTTILAESAPFTIASAGGAASLTISCAPSCTTTSDVLANYAGMPGNDKDWIAVIRSGHADTDVERWGYTQGRVDGTLDLRFLPPGTYTAKAFANNGTTVVAQSAPFDVTGTLPTPTLSPTVGTGNVAIAYASFPGYVHDWIAIAPAGSPSSSFTTWMYTGGATSGTASFPLSSGTYVARAFFDNGSTVQAESAPFTIP